LASLRKEIDDNRQLAGQLTQVISRLHGDKDASPAAKRGAVDFTAKELETFDFGGSGRLLPLLTRDAAPEGGGHALRLTTRGAGRTWLAYPSTRNAGWDLSRQNCLQLLCRLDPSETAAGTPELTVRLGRGSSCTEYHAQADALQRCLRNWAKLTIPLRGGRGWSRVDFAPFDPANVDWIEVQVWSEKPGMRLGLGSLRFDSVEFPAIDTDERAARWILEIGGALTIAGRQGLIEAPADLPPAPYQIRSVFLAGNPAVTDASLENLENLDGCRHLRLGHTRLTDEGLSHLRWLPELETLDLSGTPTITGRGAKYLERLPRLHRVMMMLCSVDDEGMRGLSHLTGLDGLFVSGPASDEGVAYLTRLPSLSGLLLDLDITDASIAHLTKCRKLWGLSLARCPRVTDDGLALLKAATVRTFNADLHVLGNRVPGLLKSLPDVEWGYGVETLTAEDVQRISQFPKPFLFCMPVPPLSDSSLRRLKELTNMVALDVGGYELSDAGIKRLGQLKTVPNLRRLNLVFPILRTKGIEAKLRAVLPNCEICIDWEPLERLAQN